MPAALPPSRAHCPAGATAEASRSLRRGGSWAIVIRLPGRAMAALGPPAGRNRTVPYASHPGGALVGWGTTARGPFPAFRDGPGVKGRLGPLPGGNVAVATAINPAGVIVGYSNMASG